MSANPGRTVYIGSLDERVSDRVLYDILIQAGRVVDLYIPRDKETDRPKGFAFAEYESEEIAEYSVKLFSGLVTLYNRTLKFAISGQDKPSPNLLTAGTPTLKSGFKARPQPVPYNDLDVSPHSARLSSSHRFSAQQSNYAQVPAPPGVVHHPNGHRSHYDSNGYNYSGRVFGAALDSISRPRSSRYDTSNPTNYAYQ